MDNNVELPVKSAHKHSGHYLNLVPPSMKAYYLVHFIILAPQIIYKQSGLKCMLGYCLS